MVQKQYHTELVNVQQKVLRLSKLANAAIKGSVKALQDHDVEQAEAVIKGDARINDLSAEIEVLCMQLPALQQPVDRDMRMIEALIKVNLDIERISDLAVDIAKIVAANNDEEHVKPLIDIPLMAHITCEMLDDALCAFGELNSTLAYDIAKRDDEIDALFDQLRRVLLTFMVENPGKIENASHLTSVAQYLEQIGDHVGNICESVVYMVTGDRVKLN
jgi:phosphate transport system protein